eukprot:UN33738
MEAYMCEKAVEFIGKDIEEVLSDDRKLVDQEGPYGSTPETYVVRKPRGVTGLIVPFNFPIIISMRTLLTSILVGNGVVVKPSPHCSEWLPMLLDCLEKSGVPKGLVNSVNGGNQVSEFLIDHEDISYITFTGSRIAGKEVAQRCGANFKQCTLEMGGKANLIILDDADVEKAVSSAM